MRAIFAATERQVSSQRSYGQSRKKTSRAKKKDEQKCRYPTHCTFRLQEGAEAGKAART